MKVGLPKRDGEAIPALAPTGRPNPSPGQRPGIDVIEKRELYRGGLGRPYRAWRSGVSKPRALPWAEVGSPRWGYDTSRDSVVAAGVARALRARGSVDLFTRTVSRFAMKLLGWSGLLVARTRAARRKRLSFLVMAPNRFLSPSATRATSSPGHPDVLPAL